MPRTIGAWAIAATAVAAVLPAPASTQYMPHLDPNFYILATMNYGGAQCLVDVPEKKIAAPRAAAGATMIAYFAAAGGRGGKSAAFKPGKAKLIAAGVTVPAAGIDAAADPLAAGGHTLDPAPLRFYRAGNQGSALGQWAVRDAGGAVVGAYTGWFEREGDAWKLRNLTIHRADEPVEPVAPYCSKPGDTTEQRVKATADMVAGAEKQLARRRAALAETQGRATAGSSVAAREAQVAAEREGKRVAKAEEALAKARETHAEAVANAEEIKRLTLPAREAERLRKAPAQDPA